MGKLITMREVIEIIFNQVTYHTRTDHFYLYITIYLFYLFLFSHSLSPSQPHQLIYDLFLSGPHLEGGCPLV